jgi:hypothetical protein
VFSMGVHYVDYTLTRVNVRRTIILK